MLLGKTLRSSTLKLAFVYIGLFSAAILSLFGYVYWSTLAYLHHREMREVAREQALLKSIASEEGQKGLVAAIERLTAGDPSGGWVYVLLDRSSTRIAGNLPGWPPAPVGRAGTASFSLADRNGAQVLAEFDTLPDGARLLTGQIDDSAEFGRMLTFGLGGALALILILATAAGISTSRRSVTRIEAINATSRKIMASGLGQRVPRRGTGDEWDELADNLNSMLDRIEQLVEANRQVSNNIAHDLRTPLTRMRGRLEQAFAQPFDAERYEKLLGDTIADLDGVLRIFSSLLRISSIEAHHQQAGFRPVELTNLAREVVDLFEPAAEEKGLPIMLGAGAGGVEVLGDRDLLFDALSNLIDNAIKHGEGAVSVTVGRRGEHAVVAVADRGPGIPADEQKNVVKRFYRLERSRHSPGSGLGLSLVAAVAHLHGTNMRMADNRPGLLVELEFPPPEAGSADLAPASPDFAGVGPAQAGAI